MNQQIEVRPIADKPISGYLLFISMILSSCVIHGNSWGTRMETPSNSRGSGPPEIIQLTHSGFQGPTKSCTAGWCFNNFLL